MTRTVGLSLLIGALALAGCSDTQRAGNEVRYSDRPADIRCVSYGQVLFQGRSTGRVRHTRSGRLQFVDAATGRLNIIDGDCRVVYAR